MAFSIYLVLGFFYNVRFKDMPPDMYAIPHVQVGSTLRLDMSGKQPPACPREPRARVPRSTEAAPSAGAAFEGGARCRRRVDMPQREPRARVPWCIEAACVARREAAAAD